jgi:hypothetical protein
MQSRQADKACFDSLRWLNKSQTWLIFVYHFMTLYYRFRTAHE